MTPYVEDPQLIEDERLAMEHYERSIRAAIRPEDDGKPVLVAVRSGDYEVGGDMPAVRRLKARRPDERLYLVHTRPETMLVLHTPRLLGS